MALGSLSHIFAFAIYFFLAFIFRSIKPKIQKYLSAIYSYLFYLAFDLSIYYNFIHVCLPIWGAATRKGLTTPFTVGLREVVICVQVLFTLCCLVLLMVR